MFAIINWLYFQPKGSDVLRRYVGRNTHLPETSETPQFACLSQCVFLPSVGEMFVNGPRNMQTQPPGRKFGKNKAFPRLLSNTAKNFSKRQAEKILDADEREMRSLWNTIVHKMNRMKSCCDFVVSLKKPWLCLKIVQALEAEAGMKDLSYRSWHRKNICAGKIFLLPYLCTVQVFLSLPWFSLTDIFNALNSECRESIW